MFTYFTYTLIICTTQNRSTTRDAKFNYIDIIHHKNRSHDKTTYNYKISITYFYASRKGVPHDAASTTQSCSHLLKLLSLFLFREKKTYFFFYRDDKNQLSLTIKITSKPVILCKNRFYLKNKQCISNLYLKKE